MGHESDSDTNCNWYSWYSQQRIDTGTGGLGNKRTSKDYPNYSIIKIRQNTKKSPGDLKRVAVSQTSVRNYRLMQVGKTLKRVIILKCSGGYKFTNSQEKNQPPNVDIRHQAVRRRKTSCL